MISESFCPSGAAANEASVEAANMADARMRRMAFSILLLIDERIVQVEAAPVKFERRSRDMRSLSSLFFRAYAACSRLAA
jgi:hypothetical protein